ncbi:MULTISPECIES: NADP-dependent oxidoreductase [unclassified Microbacterium]|uniref:quinone oxidoreductase family protein n=1 Tax=unclassified Microbacterium TaxID=2609290 RepID=UPI000AA5DCBC|nr:MULTISPECIES: NADP-dependent oxidoreductase [unclassified Microbacterium]MBN9224074.1 NADP-dependent oxidoreductase [Microbacterium sp.]
MATAIVYTELGGPEVLTVTDIEAPMPGPGEVAVHVEAAGVNPIDHKLRSGTRPSAPVAAPRHIGADAAGTVTALGEGTEGFRVGDPVVVFNAEGTYASDLVVDARHVTPRPAVVSAAEGAALGIPVSTAYQTVRSLAVGPRDVLLVHAGSGSVGQAVIQFAVLAGATVLATTSDRRAERVRSLGATPLPYGPDVVARVGELAPAGVTVAIDLIGTDEALQQSLALVADRSRIATLVRGADAAGLGIRAFRGGSPTPLTAAEERWRAEAIPLALALMTVGRFSVEVGVSLPLADAAEAHRLVEAGVDGKVVLIP